MSTLLAIVYFFGGFTHVSCCYLFFELFVRDSAVEVVFECAGCVGGGINQGRAKVFITGHNEDIGELG